MEPPNFSQFAPVSKAEIERAAQGLDTPAPAPPAPSPAATVAAAILAVPTGVAAAFPTPTPRFVGGRIRERTFALDYPIEYGDRIYEAITLRRPTSAEVGRYFERLVETAVSDPDGETVLPIFVDEAGAPIPDAVIKFLDGADDERISGAVADFLPPRLQRFQAVLQPGSAPTAGDNTGPTSST